MSKQVARVTWSRSCYSDVFWTAIVDPSPIKEGHRVPVIWGKRRKDFGNYYNRTTLLSRSAILGKLFVLLSMKSL